MATSHLSLIIPVYNRPNEVEELLDSLTRQSETNFEVVIVEDGSKETCQHVVEAFKDKLDVSYSYIPNGGPGNARNYGAKQSKGDYLIVLDSDCILPPDYIKSVNKELKETGADAFGAAARSRRCLRRPRPRARIIHKHTESHQLLHDLLLYDRRHSWRQKEDG